MVLSTFHAPRRARRSRAKTWRTLSILLGKLAKRAGRALTDPRQHYPDMSDAQARDIGLDPADLEWRRLRLPSQTSHHPRG